jgi:hypothetical protein
MQLSNGYERKIESDIKRKLRIFNELELPLLIKSGFISATANCNTVTANCNVNYHVNSANSENRAQNMERKVRELVEESEMPKKSFMNLGLPALTGQRDEDLR